jgi:predicted Fe-Mo cluster-binding NifX family protein
LIDSHFGHCESYCVFTISAKNKITDLKNVESLQGCGCKSDIANILASDGVKVMHAGGEGSHIIFT